MRRYWSGLLLTAYLLVSLVTLTRFPFVHSDEAWLASLTRSMIAERSLAATETFFHLTPRYPHALKSIFHLLQMPFVAVNFSAWSVRLLSLAASAALLVLFYRTIRDAGLYKTNSAKRASRFLPLLWTAILAVDIQFIYIGRLARQEILIMLVYQVGLFLLSPILRSPRNDAWKRTLLIGFITGGAAGIHPNAFIVGLGLTGIVLSVPLGRHGLLKALAAFGGAALTAAALFVAASFTMDSSFPLHYTSIGAAVGVADSGPEKILGFARFIGKIWNQTSGTYYLPPVRGEIVLFLLFFTSSLFVRDRMVIALRRSILFMLIGIGVIGKFSPPSISLVWSPLAMLGAVTVSALAHRSTTRSVETWRYRIVPTITGVLLGLSLLHSLVEIASTPSMRSDRYRYYIASIQALVPDGSNVLANLNTAFAFDEGQLYTWRDFAALDEDRHTTEGLTVSEYLNRRNIEYILYPDEMDLIYAQRPVWNDVYGNLYPYYGELRTFLSDHCELVGTITAPVYAMRIVRYAGREPWKVRVFKVVPGSSPSEAGL